MSRLQSLGCELKILNIKQPFKYIIGFLKIIIDFKPQIVLAHFEYYLPVILAALTLREKRFIMLHSMLVGRDYKPISRTKQLSFLTNLIRTISLKVSSEIISISDAIRQQYTSLYNVNHKIKTIYIGLSFDSLSPRKTILDINSSFGKVKICCISFNSPLKGIDVLIKALAILKHKYMNDDFILFQIGVDIRDSSSSHYLTIAENNRVSDDIVWLGIRDDIIDKISEMDIYCQPSRSEGLSFSIIEASLGGLPTIASNVGGIPEVVKHEETGFLFENENCEDLADKLNYLIVNGEKRKEMGQAAIKFATLRFDLISQSKKVVDFILNDNN